MNSSIVLRPGESRLAEGVALERIGPITFPGHLFLTSERLSFEPTRFNLFLGVPRWSIELTSVQGLALRAGTELIVHVPRRPHRLTGVGARAVHAMMTTLRGKDGPGERVLLAAPAEVTVNDLVTARGDVTVSLRAVQFEPGPLERRVWPNLAFEAAIGELSALDVAGIPRHLDIQLRGRAIRFQGEVVPHLYAAISAAREVLDGTVAAELVEHEVTSAGLIRGPVLYAGSLIRTSTRLIHIATGTLDALTGLSALIELPVDDILEIGIVGRVDRRLEIVTTATRLTLDTSEPFAQHQSLIHWLKRWLPGPAWREAPDTPTGARDRLHAVGAELEAQPIVPKLIQIFGDPTPERPYPPAPFLFSPGLLLSGDRAVAGWLMSDLHTLTWLPKDGRPALQFVFDGREIVKLGGPDTVEFRAPGGGEYRWLVADGAAFCTLLRHELERPRRRGPAGLPPAPDARPFYGRNRRQTFRVTVPDDDPVKIEAWISTEYEETHIPCTILDLSKGGCAIQTLHPTAGDARLRLRLLGDGPPSVLHVERVYERPLPNDVGWMSGWRFVERWGDAEFASRPAWMGIQRRKALKLHSGDG